MIGDHHDSQYSNVYQIYTADCWRCKEVVNEGILVDKNWMSS